MESARKDHPKVRGKGEGRLETNCSYLVELTMESARKDHPKVRGKGEGRLEFAATWSGSP
jgi:hypothetical protein